MPKYQCPECEAVLRRETPVPEGKKIKCPKCEVVFKPKAMREAEDDPDKAKKKAKVAQKSKPADDENEEGGSYSVAQEKEESAEEKKKKKVDYGSLRDKFKKSKRGPAMAKVVGTSNGMLFIGIAVALFSLLFIMYSLWPFIFSEKTPKSSRLLLTLAGAFGFVCGGCICYGGSKFHDLRSYGWSMASAVICIVVGIGILVGSVVVFIPMFSDPEMEGVAVMLLYLGILLAVAAVAFACSIGIRSIGQLKDEEMKEAFIETSEMRDF